MSKFDLGPKVKVKLNIVSLKSSVTAYLSSIGIPNVLTTNRETLYKEVNGDVKFDHGPKIKVKLTIVSLK